MQSQGEARGQSGERPRPETQSLVSLLILAILGVLAIALFALQFDQETGMAVFAVSIGLAGGTLLLGALLGFLFGIPRTIQPGGQQRDGEESDQTQGQTTYRVNTNLEQISDWLTKILVGVGLTQLGAIGGALTSLGEFFKPGLGDLESSASFAVATVLYFGVLGFLTGYLQTRLFLSLAFRAADIQRLDERVEHAVETAAKSAELAETIQEDQRQQQMRDALALSLLQRQLEPGPEEGTISQEELNNAVKDTTQAVRVQMFFRAHGIRRRNWQPSGDRNKLARTIPIFRALIASDEAGNYHRNHGQLGYALKDIDSPDLPGAVEALGEAIRRREALGDSNPFPLYEFNRALAMIMIDTAKGAANSDEQTRAQIVEDLRTANRSRYARGIIAKEESLKTWLEANGISLNELRAR